MGRLCVEYEAPHGKVPNHGCGAGDRPGGAATNGSGGFSLCRPGAYFGPNSPNRAHSVWGSRQPQLARAQAAWDSRATRTSRLARRTWLARSACLAGSSGLDRSAVLVWPSMGATAVLRHDLCGCRARHADYRCCCWLRPTSSPSRLVLVLGGSVRGNRVLGLLLSALRLNSRRSAPRPTGMGSPQRQVGQKHDRRASPGASEWQEAEPTQRIRFSPVRQEAFGDASFLGPLYPYFLPTVHAPCRSAALCQGDIVSVAGRAPRNAQKSSYSIAKDWAVGDAPPHSHRSSVPT